MGGKYQEEVKRYMWTELQRKPIIDYYDHVEINPTS